MGRIRESALPQTLERNTLRGGCSYRTVAGISLATAAINEEGGGGGGGGGNKSSGITGGHTCAHYAAARWAHKSVSRGSYGAALLQRDILSDGEDARRARDRDNAEKATEPRKAGSGGGGGGGGGGAKESGNEFGVATPTFAPRPIARLFPSKFDIPPPPPPPPWNAVGILATRNVKRSVL